MTDVFEAIKTIGGLSGIFTAIFLIYDRATKHYPVAFIEARPVMEGSANIESFLVLKNVSERPILISWTDGQSDKLIVARDRTAEGLFRYLHASETTISLPPQGEAILPLLRPSTFPEIDPENMMEIEMRWQFAQPILWRRPRMLRISIRKRDFESLIEGYLGDT
ncbi:hypothetical protein [Bradyrhizobium sp. HKCCYLS3013]|uniref:hypothetical protein n=1 Tax=Bradyrhizobium sp. HKCCYLS3013 TaxID=3420735 RepID=UPI003EB7D953